MTYMDVGFGVTRINMYVYLPSVQCISHYSLMFIDLRLEANKEKLTTASEDL